MALTGLLEGLDVADGAAFLENLNLPGLLGSLSYLLDTVTTGLGALPGFLEGIEGSLGSFLDVIGPSLNGLLATVEPLVISLGNILSSADGLLAGLVALNQSVGPIIAGITDFFTAGVQNLLVPFIPLVGGGRSCFGPHYRRFPEFSTKSQQRLGHSNSPRSQRTGVISLSTGS